MASSCGFAQPVFLAIWLATLITVACGNNTPPGTLPVFHLQPNPYGKHRAIELAKDLYGVCDFDVTNVDSRVVLLSDTHRIEVDTVHDGIWTADESRMWNDTLRPRLPDDAQARKIADDIISQHQLFPNCSDSATPFSLNFDHISGTHLAIHSGETREDHMLDTRVIYTTTVDLPGLPSLQVVGGGGEFQVVLGDEGRLIGFHGVWRQPDSIKCNATVIPPKVADAVFLNLTKDMTLMEFNSSLAYYMAPAFSGQEFLYPVYIYRGTAVVDDRQVPMRVVTLPATDFGPALDIPLPQSMTRSPSAQPTVIPRSRFRKRNDDDVLEFGTSWIGTSGGLGGSQANAQGFVDELTDEGWQLRFNWGDKNAWESDWHRNDDSYVDAVDFVFYTGHADGSGWMLFPPDDGSLDVSEVSGPPDLWGAQDLEWMIIAACGPLEDDIISPGGGDVFRWEDAFDGLHLLLGYAAVTFDNTEEGRRVVSYARGGATLINAWFRTGQEIQPSDNGCMAPLGPKVWVGAMWATAPGITPQSDHIWGRGSVSPDPVPPDGFTAMWVPC